jgi:hypothetical protein
VRTVTNKKELRCLRQFSRTVTLLEVGTMKT